MSCHMYHVLHRKIVCSFRSAPDQLWISEACHSIAPLVVRKKTGELFKKLNIAKTTILYYILLRLKTQPCVLKAVNAFQKHGSPKNLIMSNNELFRFIQIL